MPADLAVCAHALASNCAGLNAPAIVGASGDGGEECQQSYDRDSRVHVILPLAGHPPAQAHSPDSKDLAQESLNT